MKLWKKLLVHGAIALLTGVLSLIITEPTSRYITKKTTELRVGSFRRGMWEVLPFGIDFKLHIFNVTNFEDVEKGHKPIVQEVGPYIFEEWRDKVNIVDYEDDDTVEFNMRSVFYFRPEKSNGLTGDEVIIMPNLPMLAIILTLAKERPRLVSLLDKGLNGLFNNPQSVFTKIKANDLFYDGLLINCVDPKDLFGKGVCSALKEADDNMYLSEMEEDVYRFSLFASRNTTPAKQRWRVYRGIEDIEKVGMTVEYDGKPSLNVWGEGHCNSINATDGSIFPPFLDENSKVQIFAPEICRILEFRFERPSNVKAIRTGRYSLDFGDYANTPEDQCFCKSPTQCPKKGTYELAKCIRSPIAITLPHFYRADESYLQQVEGLNPEQEKHQIFGDFEMLSGNPIEFRTRVQINMQVFPINEFKLMYNFSTAMLPLLWVEEGLRLPDFVIFIMTLVHYAPAFFIVISWLQVLGGIGMIIASAIYKSKADRNKYILTKKSTLKVP